MKKFYPYFRKLGIFVVLELFIVFIISIFNLIGLNSSITTILLFVLNVTIFILFGFRIGIKEKCKGYISGVLTGLILIIFILLINILFFKGNFNINKILYYLILISSSTLGGMFGKAKKKEA